MNRVLLHKKEKRVLYLVFLHEIAFSLNISVKRAKSIHTTVYFKYSYKLLHDVQLKWRKRTFHIYKKNFLSTN